MIQTVWQRDRTARWTFTLSLTLHLLIIFVFSGNDFFRSRLHEAAPYYVDIVSLPTADPAPAGGSPAAPAPQSPPPLPAAAVQKPAMTLPQKQLHTPPSKAAQPPDQVQKEQEALDFREKMNRLEQNAAARRQADAIAALQKKVAEKKGSGPATASGSSAGSDYGAYIQSRLQDALSTTIAFQSQHPEAAVQIYIDRSGRLIKYVMVRPSPDKLFNNAVIRAIEKAKVNFTPVPSGKGFDKLYVFSPQEVQK